MTIYQPRRENVSTWVISVTDLRKWAEKTLKPKAELAFKGEGEYCPGSWCQFCKAAVKCRARADAKLQLAKYEFAQPPLLSDAEIGDILGKLEDLTKWANELMAYAQDAAVNHGKQWPGYKLVESRTNRKYADEDAVVAAARAAGYTDIFKKSLIPITEMEKLMGKKTFAEVLGDLVIKPKGKPTLVPASDRRPAITSTGAKQDFTDYAGAPVKYRTSGDDPNEEPECLLGSISWKISGAWMADKDYAWANILEAYYAMTEANIAGKDFNAMRKT